MERETTCCFTGHRPDKLPWRDDEWDPRCQELKERLAAALEEAFPDGETVHPKVLTQGLIYYPSDHRKFKFHVAVCACRRLPGLGYYIPWLRTRRDTRLSLDNIACLAEGIGRFIPCYLREKEA